MESKNLYKNGIPQFDGQKYAFCVSMFTGGVCLSLMARTTTTMANRTTVMMANRTIAMMTNRKGSKIETFEYLENLLSRKRSVLH
jgi:hypothetical protein